MSYRTRMKEDMFPRLTELIFLSREIEPNKRRETFDTLTQELLKYDLVDQEQIDEEIGNFTPQFQVIEGCGCLSLELPNGYSITLGDYARPVSQWQPNFNIAHIEIRHWHPVRDEDELESPHVEKYFSLEEHEEVIQAIQEQKELDDDSKQLFIDFVKQIADRYK